MRFLKIGILMYSLILALASCEGPRVYETNIDLDPKDWPANKPLDYKFEIKDKNKPYTLYYNVRYSNTYPYYNLYVKYALQDSTGKVIAEKLQGMDLMDPKTGQPRGSGLGDLFDYRVLAIKGVKFPHNGHYNFRVTQYMRDKPLQGIVSFGLRIEEEDGKEEK